MEKAGIENSLIPRFVDDITFCPSVIPAGLKLVNENLQYFGWDNICSKYHKNLRTFDQKCPSLIWVYLGVFG